MVSAASVASVGRMGKGVPVSRATREEIVACYIQGYNVEQTLQQLGGPLRGLRSLPSRATVCRVRSVWRKSGTIALARGRGVGASDQGLSASLAIIIRQWCRRPDGKKRGTRLKRLQSFLHMHPDVNRVVHTSLLCRWLRRLGLTRKKGTRVAKEQDPIKVSMFWTRCQILGLDPDATVWFDESGIGARDWRMEWGYAPVTGRGVAATTPCFEGMGRWGGADGAVVSFVHPVLGRNVAMSVRFCLHNLNGRQLHPLEAPYRSRESQHIKEL